MCISPVSIPNTNYRPSSLRSQEFYHFDVSSKWITRPCGHCYECLQSKQADYVQRSLVQSLTHEVYMVTLTYSNEAIPIVRVGDLVVNYPDFHDLQNMFKLIRKYWPYPDRDFKYLAVSERGGKRHRSHFHILIYVRKHYKDKKVDFINIEFTLSNLIKKYWSRNIGTNKNPIYKPNCLYVSSGRFSSFDCHWVHPNPKVGSNGSEDVAFYSTKYALKFDKYTNFLYAVIKREIEEKQLDVDFFDIWSLVRPKIAASKYLGDDDPIHFAYIKDCIDKSLIAKQESLSFINPVNGKTFPLCGYYLKKYLNNSISKQLFDNRPDETKLTEFDTSVYDVDLEKIHSEENRIDSFNRRLDIIRSNNSDNFYRASKTIDYIPDYLKETSPHDFTTIPLKKFDFDFHDDEFDTSSWCLDFVSDFADDDPTLLPISDFYFSEQLDIDFK